MAYSIHRKFLEMYIYPVGDFFGNISGELQITFLCGILVYATTSIVGNLMNLCNWCWQHHRNPDGRCAIDLHDLGKV